MKRMLTLLLVCLLTLAHAEDLPLPNPAADTLAQLQTLTKAEGSLCAAAYLGYGEDIGSVLRSAELADMRNRYPFVQKIPAMDTVIQPGGEVYCVVPAQGVLLTVWGLDITSEAYPEEAVLLYQGGNPLLLMGNVSDILPNLRVEARDASGAAVVFEPFMSLRDGSFAMHPAGDGVLDFTLYAEGFEFEED